MKVGILTFQNANSYGAVMQTYALQEAIRSIEGMESYVINYDSPGMGLKNVQKRVFREFIDTYLQLTEPVSSGENIETEGFQAFVVGSDQVWNTLLTQEDMTYFLNFAGSETIKIAYAASIGLNNPLVEQTKYALRRYLPDFKAVSLREQSHVPQVEECAGCPVCHMVDPSLLLTAEDYERAFSLEDISDEYIFLYNLQVDPKLTDYANMLSLHYGLPIIAISQYESYYFVEGAKKIMSPSPVRWLNYLKNAKLVLTDSFHGVMFSIIFNRPFYVYTQATYNVVRVLDALKLFGLNERRLAGLSDVRDVDFEMDYAYCNQVLESERTKAYEYLRTALKEESGTASDEPVLEEQAVIASLKAENQNLQAQLKAVNSTLHEFYSAYSELITQVQGNKDSIQNIIQYLTLQQAKINNIKYEIMDPEARNEEIFFPKFRSNEETLRLILEEGKSLARFGDGEFSIAFQIPRQKFQRLDDRLAKRIWETIHADCPDLLIAIAKNYGSLEVYNEQGANGIRLYMTPEIRSQHRQILPIDKVYSDAYITRAYVLYQDVFTDGPKKRFDALKAIWEQKNIIIVEGAQTRLGVGNDLFAGAKTIKRIIAPPTSSFDRYDDILKECLKRGGTADLFLLAIGPSSGVLAYDLCRAGYQAVDVGHIDLEYEWFLAGKGVRVPVPNKYNNEMPEGDQVALVKDPVYESQIVASFL